MGLTSLPTVGTAGTLGPVKLPRPLQVTDTLRDILVDEHNAAMTALEEVCAAVGLADGSTADSLVALSTAARFRPLSATHTGVTLTLADSDTQTTRGVDAGSNAVAIEIPDTLTDGFECLLIVTNPTNAITISTGAGLLSPVYYGQNTIGTVMTLVTVTAYASAGLAMVTIVEPVP